MKSQTLVLKPSAAPDCFGLASIFDPDQCGPCPERHSCEATCLSVLRKVSEKVNVGDILDAYQKRLEGAGETPIGDLTLPPALPEASIVAPQRTVKMAFPARGLTPEQEQEFSRLPVKVAKKLRAMARSGTLAKIHSLLLEGQNPFDDYGNRFLRTACDELLRGGFTKASLRGVYETLYGWSEGTAFSRVSVACSILKTLKIAVEKDGRHILSPTYTREN